jgi:hypothetical protein
MKEKLHEPQMEPGQHRHEDMSCPLFVTERQWHPRRIPLVSAAGRVTHREGAGGWTDESVYLTFEQKKDHRPL